MHRATLLFLVASAACATKPVFSGVHAVEVSLVSAQGVSGPVQHVAATDLPAWSACLERTHPIGADAAIKAALTEGEYHMVVLDSTGSRKFTLHNSANLTDSGPAFYQTDCLYPLAQKLAQPAPAPKSAAFAPPPSPAPKSIQDNDSLVLGKSLAEITARYGEPTRTYSFKMGDGIPEFRIELFNTYPPGDEHKDVQILEHTYQLDGYKFTVWYHEQDKGWRGLEAVSYSDGVDF
jgi:hypothetical protein